MKKHMLSHRTFLLCLFGAELAALIALALFVRLGGLSPRWLGAAALAVLALDAAALLSWYVRRAGADDRRALLAAFAIALAASVPLWIDYLPYGHDLEYHLLRIDGIADGLRGGQFPVRIHPNSASGFGYAAPLFYPEALLYLPAALRFAGVPVMTAYQIFLFAINVATSFVAYGCFRRMFGGRRAGLCGAFVYTLSLYRLTNEYTRAALGETCAMLFLPLVMYGMYRILTEDTAQKAYRTAFLPLFLGMTGLLSTHLLSTEIAALLLALVCIVCFRRAFQPRRLLELCKAAGACVVSTLGFTVPMLLTIRGDEYQVFRWGSYDRAADAANPAQLFPLFPSAVGESNPLEAGAAGEMPLGIGLGAALVLLLAAYLLWTSWRTRRSEPLLERTRGGAAGLCCALAALCLWMSTYLFPWTALYRAGGALASFGDLLQFPWRMLGPAALCAAACACWCHTALEKANRIAHPRAIVAVICAAMCITACAYTDSLLQTAPAFRAYTYADLDNARSIGDGEYLPADFTESPIDRPAEPMPDDTARVDSFNANSAELRFSVENLSSASPSYVDLPRTFYPGYVAYADDGATLALTRGDNGSLRVVLPAAFMGAVTVRFSEPPVWRAATLIGWIGFAAILAAALLSRRAERKQSAPANAGA